jgi:hypothetical protein
MVGRELLGRPLDNPCKSKFLKKDREGVASVVGTIMALLVFLTFMSLFVGSYVPIWMKDNERGHMSQVMGQFGDLKGKVDNLIAYSATVQMYQSIVVGNVISTQSTKMYQSFELGAPGVPIFASQTAGALIFTPKNLSDTGMRIEFRETGRTTNTTFPSDPNEKSGGKLSFYGPNRYYVQQWIVYENGGVLIKQDDGQTYRAAPNILLDWNKGGFVNLTVTQIDMIGANSSIGGFGNVGVNVNIDAIDLPTNYIVNPAQRNLYMNVSTQYGDAFYSYLNSSCAYEGLVQTTGSHTGHFGDNETIRYGATAGGPPLVELIKHKIANEKYVVTLHLLSAFKITYNLATMTVQMVQ